MEFTEQQVYEAMGLTVPPDEAGTQQEPTGANEPGVAAPAAEETNGAPEGGDTGTTDGEGAEGTVTALIAHARVLLSFGFGIFPLLPCGCAAVGSSAALRMRRPLYGCICSARHLSRL